MVSCCGRAIDLARLAYRYADDEPVGQNRINIAVRFRGLLLIAVAVEIFVSGLTTLLAGLR